MTSIVEATVKPFLFKSLYIWSLEQQDRAEGQRTLGEQKQELDQDWDLAMRFVRCPVLMNRWDSYLPQQLSSPRMSLMSLRLYAPQDSSMSANQHLLKT